MALRIKIRNFKSIHALELELVPGVNLLVGPNGAGKTCILSALKFIRNVLMDGAALAVARGGGPQAIYTRGRRFLEIEITSDCTDLSFRGKRCPTVLSWHFQVRQQGPENIATIVKERFCISCTNNGRESQILTLEFKRSPTSKRSRLFLADSKELGRDFLAQWRTPPSKPIRFAWLQTQLAMLRKHQRTNSDISVVRSISYRNDEVARVMRPFFDLEEYNITPNEARKPSDQLFSANMESDGSGVSQVLHALEARHFYLVTRRLSRSPSSRHFGFRESEARLKPALKTINEHLSLAVPPIQRVATRVEETTGRRMLLFKSGENEFLPSEVSDGTIKWLCLLVSVYVSDCPLNLLEEPENFLHPWMQQILIKIMREQAKRDSSIFLLTSHSPVLLNAALPNEVFLITQGANGTKLNGATTIRSLESAIADTGFGIGDYWVTGAIGGVPTGG